MPNTRSNPKWNEIVTIRGCTELLDTACHSRFRRVPVTQDYGKREDTQEMPMTDITLSFTEPPKDGTPWYSIGHDSESYNDIYLDIKSHCGVSRCHALVGFDDWGQVVIKDISSYGCVFTYTKKASGAVPGENSARDICQDARSKVNKNNPPVWVIPVGWEVTVELGDSGTPFIFRAPDHSDYIEQYRQRVLDFKRVQNNPLPFLGGLQVTTNSQRATTKGLLTEAQRVAHGKTQGRYAWIISDRILGTGAYGEVVEVFNTTNWGMCAGKRMKIEMTFQNESKVLRTLQHKHIVQYVDVVENTPTSPSMIVMEYFSLGDLRSQHKATRFSEPEIIEIIAQTASALAYLHEKKVTHRDLKPANILVRSRDPVEVAVADFGVAKSEESSMYTYTGTYQYMAPGVVSNRPSLAQQQVAYTNQADIWSLGIVALSLLLGALPDGPTAGKDENYYARYIHSSRDRLLTRCKNREFAHLVKEMLQWSYSERPTAEECLQQASLLVPKARDADSRSGESGRRRKKDHAAGESRGSGSVAATTRVLKREGTHSSTARPPAKKPSTAGGPSTKRDPDRELESMFWREVENSPDQPVSDGTSDRPASDRTPSTPGPSVWEKLGTAPPTKSQGS